MGGKGIVLMVQDGQLNDMSMLTRILFTELKSKHFVGKYNEKKHVEADE